MGFLDEYMKRGQKPSKLSPHVIRHNRFDNEDYQSVKRQIDKFAVAHDQLAEVAETGYEAMQDTWYSFFKVDPEFLEDGEIRPKFLVNKRVMDEARELDDFKKLRDFSAGDDVGSAIGATTIEPDLESLFERDEMKQAQQKANHLDEILEELLGMDGEDGMAAYGEGEGEQQEGGAQPQNLQEDQEKIEELRKALQEKAEKAEKDLNDALDQAKKEMKARLQQALNRAAREAETTMTSADSWGLGRSEFIRLPANKRFEYAQKFNTEKFRRMAELIGRLRRLLWSEQQRKVEHTVEEITSVSMGADLQNMLPSEFLALADEDLELQFWMRRSQDKLAVYELEGVDHIGKGAIICCVDTSGSMMGDSEIWAKAVALTLLHFAREQKREYHGILFSGPNDMIHFDFSDIRNVKLDQVLEFADTISGGGPLRVDQRVITPEGWKAIGKIEVGDKIYGPDGDLTTVTGFYPQGELDLYEVTFSDGATVVCDKSHIWTVRTTGAWKKMTLEQMLNAGLHDGHNRFQVPITEPVQFPAKNQPVDPYLLGYLLGNGSLSRSSVGVTSAPGDEVEWMKLLPDGIEAVNREKREGFVPSYQLVAGRQGFTTSNPLIESLTEIGLWCVTREEKHIPDTYLYGSVEQRVALLQGLCDSDGSIDKPGRVEYGTVSQKLAVHVQELARSLGCPTTVKKLEPRRSNEQTFYKVSIRVRPDLTPFRLERYVSRWKPRTRFAQSIVSAVPVEKGEAVCIRVDREDGLFLTEDYVVTHNTDFVTPLSKSLDLLMAEHERTGRVTGDIFFCTDGMAGVPNDWLEEFKKKQEELEFKIFGALIGGHPDSEPLATICDNRVMAVEDLRSGADVRYMFGKI